jgi:hypothetical protein
MKKGKLMSEAAVQALSVHHSDGQGQPVFFTGIVSAGMKKNVSYNMKLTLDPLYGAVENAHCECGAGEGPCGTCKHIVAVLLVLVKFVETGDLEVIRSCTEELQSFKRPTKLHSGRPVRAEELGKTLADDGQDDPRPLHLRDNAASMDYVRNATVNFAALSGMDVAWRYAFPSADIQEAMKDHQYLERPFCQY